MESEYLVTDELKSFKMIYYIQRPEEGDERTGGCELPGRGPGNQNLVL